MTSTIIKRIVFAVMVTSVLFTGCKPLLESSKYKLSEGNFKVNSPGYKGKSYVIVGDDSLKVYPLNVPKFDSSKFLHLAFPPKSNVAIPGKNLFITKSFDLDIHTILFKYRPSVNHFPNQFSTNLNGVVYVGYRSDVFNIVYSKKPLYYKRRIEHYGYSIGGFIGLGGTAMNPWVTEYNITSEYDGFVLTKGASINLGLNNFTFGIALGWDHLLDRNREYWIYQGKPWLGLTIGVNVN